MSFTTAAVATPLRSAEAMPVGERITSILEEVGCDSQTPTHMLTMVVPSVELDLRTMLEPFYAKLRPPHTKFAGAGGVPLDERLWPESVEDVIAMISQEREPRSFVLHLEELEAAPPPFAEMLEPFLPLNDMTAHVYVSNQGASALKNHTDVTEILVLQLLGRKEWLYCREREEPVLPWLPAETLSLIHI